MASIHLVNMFLHMYHQHVNLDSASILPTSHPLILFSCFLIVGTRRFPKNCGSHIDASLSRQPLVKGERLVRYEVNAVMLRFEHEPASPMVLLAEHDCVFSHLVYHMRHCWQKLAS